jgi:hypothetical protein
MKPITTMKSLFNAYLVDGYIVLNFNEDAVSELDSYQGMSLLGALEAAKTKAYRIWNDSEEEED